MRNVISEMVHKDRCSGCGICAGLCPSEALSMTLQENGDLVPIVDNGRCQDKCHICLDICPFSNGFHNPRENNAMLFRDIPNSKYEDDIGWYLHSVVGYRIDDGLRKASASGGLATWCLEKILKKGFVKRVALVRIAQNQDKGFFEFYTASSVEDLRKSSGSVYHPVEISQILKNISAHGEERWAVVGVPCLCAAIRNVHRLKDKIPFVFGLACGMYQNTFYTEMLLAKSGVDRRNITNIEYRRKSDGASPSDYRFRGTDNRVIGRDVPYRDLPYYLGKNAFFRLNACNYCMDVFAETADVCFMDAWLPAYHKESKGTSLVVIRNNLLNELLQQGKTGREIWIDDIRPDDVIRSQRGHVRRKRELIYMRRRVQKPDNTGTAAVPTLEEKMRWWMQRCAQRRSKKAWSVYGRTYGKKAFWIAITDLLLMQRIMRIVVFWISLPQRVIGKIRRVLSNHG